MIQQRDRKVNLSATAAASMMMKTRDKSMNPTLKPLPDIYITNSCRPVDFRNVVEAANSGPAYIHFNQLTQMNASGASHASNQPPTQKPPSSTTQNPSNVEQMFRYIYSLQQSPVNYQITFFEVPEPIFGDYLTKYASQGYILSEVSASIQT